MKPILIVLIFMSSLFNLNSQVTSVNYQMKYDTSSCMYDCYIIIIEGMSYNPFHRIQGSSQYSIVVPAGSDVGTPINHMPLINNLNYTGYIPQTWSVSNIVYAPVCQPESDFYGITPSLAPTGFYNDLVEGDTIKIFSLPIYTLNNCTDGVRVFENGIDPDFLQPGMQGADYSNGFTLGGLAQLYFGNSTQQYPPSQVVSLCEDDSPYTISYWIEESCCVDSIVFESCMNYEPYIFEDEMIIDHNLVINGNGIGETIFDGGLERRLFTILPGATLTLRNLTLQNSFSSEVGGAIKNHGKLILDNVLFENNYEGGVTKAMSNYGDIVISNNTVIIRE